MPVKRFRSVGAVNLVLAILLSIVGAQVPAAETPAPAPTPAPTTARSVAPEAEICKGCHEKYVESYLTTKHGQQGNLKGPDCQTCHANALEHAKAGGGRGVAGIFGFNRDGGTASCRDTSMPVGRAAWCLAPWWAWG